jgi:hypothetical protein
VTNNFGHLIEVVIVMDVSGFDILEQENMIFHDL